jgi:hypothetical protein
VRMEIPPRFDVCDVCAIGVQTQKANGWALARKHDMVGMVVGMGGMVGMGLHNNGFWFLGLVGGTQQPRWIEIRYESPPALWIVPPVMPSSMDYV